MTLTRFSNQLMPLLNFDQTALTNFRMQHNSPDFPITEAGDHDLVNGAYFNTIQSRYLLATPINILRNVPPFESHPYLVRENLDAAKIIIGTFPPSSYLRRKYMHDIVALDILNQLNISSTPEIDTFYGNMPLFWKKVLGINVPINSTPAEKIAVIHDHLAANGIGISDIVSACCRTKLTSPADDDLVNIIPNRALIDHLTICDVSKSLIFTSGAWEIGINPLGFFRPKKSAFSLFLEAIQALGGVVSFKIGDLWLTGHNRPAVNQIRSLEKNLCLTIKWQMNGIESQEHSCLLMPSPSAVTARIFMRMLSFKKWLNWRSPAALTVLTTLEQEISQLPEVERKVYPKKEQLNGRLRAIDFIGPTDDIEFEFKSAIYREALGNNIGNLRAIQSQIL